MEGLSSSSNIQGVPVDALVAIIKHHRVDNVLKWVDDFCSFWVPILPPLIAKVALHTATQQKSLPFSQSQIHSVCHGTQLKSKAKTLHHQ